MRRGAGARSPVLVIGAGPVGLSCALALRAHGVSVTVLEAQARERPGAGSRAIYVHGTTLRILDSMRPGLGWDLARSGILWSTKRTFWRGREVFARTYPAPPQDVLPPFTSLSQVEIERLLSRACDAAGVEVLWDTRVRDVTAHDDGVHVADASGTEWRAEYVVGADGSRSRVRHAIGVSMRGSRSENSYVIVDVDEDSGDRRPLERVFHYEHPAAGGRNVLLVPFAGGWRIDLQCKREDDPAAFGGVAATRWVGAVMGPRYTSRIRWVSTYRFLQVVASALTDGTRRVLLTGEAAHLFAPFGARGLNSGIADAAAAAGAISAALGERGATTRPHAVEAFAASRLAAAHRNRKAAGRALAATESGNPWHIVRRRLAGALAVQGGRAAAWLDAAPYGPRLRDAGGSEAGY